MSFLHLLPPSSRNLRKGISFNLMVAGESGLGKTTLINSLFLTELYPDPVIPMAEKTVQLEPNEIEIEGRGVKLRLTVVDTPGFGDAIDNSDSFQQIIKYIDQQFDRLVTRSVF